jgi:hypothetical protein
LVIIANQGTFFLLFYDNLSFSSDIGSEIGRKKFKSLSSVIIARDLLKNSRFDGNGGLCPFHEEIDNIEHCTLGKIRRRAFIIMDRLCDVSTGSNRIHGSTAQPTYHVVGQ